MAVTNEQATNPEQSSAYKVQIFAQAIVLQRRNSPKQEMQKTDFGVEVPVTNWYDEYECEQLACNFNALYLKQSDFEKYWEELGKAVKKSMMDKGLLTN
jgi:uncharacterized LabA/DUF88 family protein